MANYRGFTLVKGPDNIHKFPETDSQEFYIGAPVGLTSGKLVALSDDAEDGILGIAMEDSTNDADAETDNSYLSVSVISEEQEWSAHVDTDSAPEDAEIGAGYELEKVSNEWFVDTDNAASNAGLGFVILREGTKDDDTDGGVVIGKFGEDAYLGNKG